MHCGVQLGDPSKSHRVLGWQHRVGFRDLVTMMVRSDLSVVAEEAVGAGRKSRSGE
jgi:GDP-D-mannose dehydratase